MQYKNSLAICSNGAVALGAYEAGVMAQLYADVEAINAALGPDAIVIDAMAGASAGAVTLLLLSQAISVGASPEDLTKRLKDLWVEGFRIENLLGQVDNTSNSAFDPNSIMKLSPLVVRSDDEMRAGASDKAPTIAMWIAITNVDGIPYRIPIDNGTLVAKMYADYEPILVQKGVAYRAPAIEKLKSGVVQLETRVPWESVRDTAIASAAFPFAFKSQQIRRDLKNYPSAIYPDPDHSMYTFNYVDGGVLNNNPLGRAIDAASYIETIHSPGKNRYYVVIEPDPATEAQAQKDLSQVGGLLPNGLPPSKMIGALVNTYFNDALYRDLATAARVNDKIDATEKKVKKLIDEGKITEKEADEILDAAGFSHKKKINIERIPGASRDHDLAGAFAGHFGGFFSREYRKYDFAVGCAEARNWARARLFSDDNLASDRTKMLVALDAHPILQSTLPENTSPNAPVPGGFRGMPAGEFAKTKDKMAERAGALIKNITHASGIVNLAIGLFQKYLRKLLDDKLK